MKDDQKHTTFIMADTASQLERFDNETPLDVTDLLLIKGNPNNTDALDVVRDVVLLCDNESSYFNDRAALQRNVQVEKQPERNITVNLWKVEKEVAR